MNKNVEIGTFTWDDNKLSNQIAANYLEMQKLSNVMREGNQVIKQAGNAIKDLEKKIESERRAQERLSDQLDQGYISQEKYNEEIEKSNGIIDQFIDQQEEAIRTQANFALEVTKTQVELRTLRQDQGELNNLLAAGRTEIEGNEGAYKELNRELNALKIEAKNLGIEMVKLELAGKKDSDEYNELAARFAEVSTQTRELNDQFVNLDNTVGDNQRSVGSYKDAITSAFSEITEGLMQMSDGNVLDGFEQVKSGLSGITANARMLFATLLANPVTAILVAFAAIGAGIALGVKEVFDYNKSIAENYTLTNNLFNNLGDKTQKYLDEVRNNITGIGKTFDIEFGTLANTVDKLLDTGAVKDEFEALDIIKNGLLSAPDKDEFIANLEAAAEKSKQTGLNIQEVINLNKALEDSPVDADAVYGALDKATKNLTEQSDKTRDALSSSLGSAFTGDLLNRIDTGKTTVTEALVEISKQSDKMGLSVSQSANLGATLFGKSAVAAGGLENVMLMVNKAYDEQVAKSTPLQKATEELTQANIELAKEKDKALKSDSILVFQKNLEVFWVKAQTIWYGFVDAIIDVVKWYDNLTGSSEILGEAWDSAVQFANSLWEMIVSLADVFTNLFTALGLSNSETQSYVKTILKALNPLNLIKTAINIATSSIKFFTQMIQAAGINLSTFGIAAKSIFSQIASAAKSFLNLDFEGGLAKLKNINLSKEFSDARKEAERIFALNKANKNKTVSPTAAPGEEDKKPKNPKPTEPEKPKKEPKTKAEKKVDDAEKKLQEEAKRTLEIAKETAEQKTEIAKSELANYIAVNAEKLKNDKTLNKSKLQAELDYYDEVRKLQQQANNAEEVAKVLSIQQKIDEINKKKELSQNDFNEIKNLNAEIENIHRDFYNKELQLDNETNEKKAQARTDYETKVQEQRKLAQAIEFQQKILDLEAQGASEFEIQKVQEEQRFQQELADWAEKNQIKMDLDNDKYISDQEIQLERDQLQNAYDLTKDENEKLRIKNQLDSLDLLTQQSAERQKQIDKAAQQAKIDTFASAFGSIKTLFGESTAVGKAAAIAETTINTYKAAQAAYAAGASLGGPLGAVMGPILAGLAVASGLKNVQKIVSVKADKAAKGKMITGPSHANGGVPIMTPDGMIEAEGGEVIINKKSSALYAKELSAINQAGGGVPLAKAGGVIGSNLATVQKSVTQSIDLTAMKDVLRDAVFEGSVNGTSVGSQEGFENLSQNRKIAIGANH